MAAEEVDFNDGAPRSRRYGDIYFSAEDGLAEARAVYLQGCGLPDGWAGRRRFVVAELGFGTGLNALALIDLWRRTRPSADARLHVFSLEAHPLDRPQAAQALQPFSELAALAQPLLADWPSRPGAFHRIEWPEHGVLLDVACLEAAKALSEWTGRADAWFLDGFSPAKNPQIWREEVLALVRARSQPGARAASFTVAGAVRRTLSDLDFEVRKARGHGRKAERLEARLPGRAAAEAAPDRPLVIGAGIAGASLARAFRRLGLDPLILDPSGAGGGASGVPAVIVSPRLDAGLGPDARLQAEAFLRAQAVYRRETPDAVIAEGVLQLSQGPKDDVRFRRIAAWEGFPERSLRLVSAADAGLELGEDLAAGGLMLEDALVLRGSQVAAAWSGSVLPATVAAIAPSPGGLEALGPDGALIGRSSIVCVAAGFDAEALAGPLGLTALRGQTTFVPGGAVGRATAFGGYAVPADGGVLLGSTHTRGDVSGEARSCDDAENFESLRRRLPVLAARLQPLPRAGRAGVRAFVSDHRPLAGATGTPGLFVLAGLGGRGYSLAPLLAEAVAALALGAPGPLAQSLMDRVAPARAARPKAAPIG